jgi:hypothetical protein
MNNLVKSKATFEDFLNYKTIIYKTSDLISETLGIGACIIKLIKAAIYEFL